MRTISSRTLVGTLLPPTNCPDAVVGLGKMPPNFPPAFSRRGALGSIAQSGMVFSGNGFPGTRVACTAGEHPAPNPATPVGTVARPAGRTAPVPAPLASGYELASGTV